MCIGNGGSLLVVFSFIECSNIYCIFFGVLFIIMIDLVLVSFFFVFGVFLFVWFRCKFKVLWLGFCIVLNFFLLFLEFFLVFFDVLMILLDICVYMRIFCFILIVRTCDLFLVDI